MMDYLADGLTFNPKHSKAVRSREGGDLEVIDSTVKKLEIAPMFFMKYFT